MFTGFITRKQYDALVARFPAFMAMDWPKHFLRKWTLIGVHVSASEGWMHALNCNVKVVS